MRQDRRGSEREVLSLPITIDGAIPALTRNVSVDGLYFLVQAGVAVGKWVSIEYENAASRLKFTARGEVLRLDHGPYYTGVAVRLQAQRLLAMD